MTGDATVLLVDDEQAVLDGLRRALRAESWEILCARSAEEALRILDEHDVDVVVSDHDMPGTRGTTLLATVRERTPDVTRLMLTGKATLATALEAINAAGVTQFLVKPLDAEALAAAIRRALRERVLALAVQSSQAVLLVEAHTKLILHASPAAERLLAASPLKGRDVRPVLARSATGLPVEVDRQLAVADGQPWRLLPAGEPPLEVEVRVWMPSGLDHVVCVTLEDITERTQLERRITDLQKSETVGQVTAGVLHDLNNLLDRKSVV